MTLIRVLPKRRSRERMVILVPLPSLGPVERCGVQPRTRPRGYRLVGPLEARSGAHRCPGCVDEAWLSGMLKEAFLCLPSCVECCNHELDRRSRHRPVVLYACRCFFWDFSFLFSEMGARSLCEQGRWRHDEDPAVLVRGDAPCCRGRAVAVDHLPMAMKEHTGFHFFFQFTDNLIHICFKVIGTV